MAGLGGVSRRFLRNISPSNSTYPASRLFFYRTFASKLFVKGVSFLTTEERLAGAFSQFGHVLEGYGFVTFATEIEADKAVEAMNGKVLDGRALVVRR
ncbi:small RNA-binding protein 11, chloroplastic-like isoform X2 [Tripterygium wilfordii]|uniref:small RNA-binding protein 11, chloroplastic-like isoform X2 n=1 Tax=Tripterygium wilfordii TaxID=458696 RepID=UPI0018F861E2|nr:small RNA-binding protein 11, chloroplastic-like isoform X2 [Tripterygium wilfordii]